MEAVTLSILKKLMRTVRMIGYTKVATKNRSAGVTKAMIIPRFFFFTGSSSFSMEFEKGGSVAAAPKRFAE